MHRFSIRMNCLGPVIMARISVVGFLMKALSGQTAGTWDQKKDKLLHSPGGRGMGRELRWDTMSYSGPILYCAVFWHRPVRLWLKLLSKCHQRFHLNDQPILPVDIMCCTIEALTPLTRNRSYRHTAETVCTQIQNERTEARETKRDWAFHF